MMGYTKKTDGLKLGDSEGLYRIDKSTGEVREVKHRPNNIPVGKEVFGDHTYFTKYYPNSWIFLKRYCTHLELSAIIGLVNYARNGNSLEPITDDMKPYLIDILGVSKNKINSVLDWLFKIGVYGRFSVAEVNKPYTKYWVLNPYLVYNGGKLIYSDIKRLFDNTHIAKASCDPQYTPRDLSRKLASNSRGDRTIQ